MTSLLRRILVGLGAVAVGAAGATQERDPLAPLPTQPRPQPQQRSTYPKPSYPPPSYPQPSQAAPIVANGAAPAGLRQEIDRLGRSFDGKAGIAIVNLNDGWEIDYNAGSLFPQQSCSKLWVAITTLDAVDRGALSLSDKVTLGSDDLTLFHQPLAAKIRGGGHTTTLGALMFTAITESDNTANDKLMRSVGGPDAVRATIERKGLGAIRFFNGERSLQSKIAGLTWSQSYSIGDAFYKARSALPMPIRRASFISAPVAEVARP